MTGYTRKSEGKVGQNCPFAGHEDITSRDRVCDVPWLGGWVCPGAGLDALKYKISPDLVKNRITICRKLSPSLITADCDSSHNTYFIYLYNIYCPPPHGVTAPIGPGHPQYWGFTITLRHTTLGRTPPDEWSARSRELYLTTSDNHKRHTSMPPAGFEPTILARERSQTHALEYAATRIDIHII